MALIAIRGMQRYRVGLRSAQQCSIRGSLISLHNASPTAVTTLQTIESRCESRRPMAMSASEQMQQFWEKQEKLQRPLSPHLAVYKMELPMITSLVHRGTGIAMYGGVVILAYTVAAMPMDLPTAVETLRALELPSAVWWGVKATCAYPLIYHYMNGIRHLLWDRAIGFDLKVLHRTGYTALALSLLMAAVVGAQ